jgi:hypothetical protein
VSGKFVNENKPGFLNVLLEYCMDFLKDAEISPNPDKLLPEEVCVKDSYDKPLRPIDRS